MNWKEQFDKELCTETHLNRKYINQLPNEVKDFISTEIIEKLIADIPDEDGTPMPIQTIKDQLRDKWL
jgi:hypothetical protein